MKTVIYLDVLLAINFILDYYLLLATRRLASARSGSLRMVLGSAVAAASSLILLAPPMPWLLSGLCKLLFCAASVRTAFCYTGLRGWLKSLGWFFLLNFLLAGMVFFALTVFSASGIHQNNFSVYFDVSPWLLLLSVLTLYLVLELFSLLFRPPSSETVLELSVELDKVSLVLSALYDTGFALKDIFSGEDAVLISLPAARRQLAPCRAVSLERYFATGETTQGVHLVPCKTASGSGLLPAVSGVAVTLRRNGQTLHQKKVTAVFVKDSISGGVYGALVGNALAGQLV
ncbi:MAG: sigma-E processing peptidase SpoIIGA [Pygmaiobacter sp.]